MLRLPTLATLAVLSCAVACGEPPAQDTLPPLEWEGERVFFGTELFDEVCVGTLVWLDATIESIEAELELAPSDDTISFYLLTPEAVDERCGPQLKACVLDGKVYSSPSGFENARHELVHARLDQLDIWGKPLFYEGIAAALDKDGGCLASVTCAEADLDALLSASSSLELADIADYTPGADLVHGLLEIHGPEAVLAFMAELSGDMPPDEVRSIYLEHFGSVLDEDFQAFMRSPFADYTVGQRGCDSLASLTPNSDHVLAFEALMDCSSPDVVNYINDGSKGSIMWSFEVTPADSGTFSFSVNPGSPPPDGLVELEMCHPPPFGPPELADLGQYTFRWSWSAESEKVTLAPGQYRVWWLARFGESIDIELTPPCVFEDGGCPAGEQCTIWNDCLPEVESPASLGESCQQEPGAPLSCEAGSRCIAGVCVAECDATQPCDAGQACSRIRVCGTVCDLLTQDCAQGFNCLPTGDDALNASGVGACVAGGDLGYLDNCNPSANECAPGLSCEGIAPPYDSPCALVIGGGCCVPLCDSNSSDPGCPAEVNTCDPIQEGPVGICR